MTIMLSYSRLIVLFFMLCQVHYSYCLDCYECTTTQENRTECHTVKQCSSQDHCRAMVLANGSVILGCATAEECHVTTTVATTTHTVPTTTATTTTMMTTTTIPLSAVDTTTTTSSPMTTTLESTSVPLIGTEPTTPVTTANPMIPVPTKPKVIGRSLNRRADSTVVCDICCTSDACNKKLCAAPPTHNVTNGTVAKPCFDQQGTDFCKTAKDFLKLCDDIQRAKIACKSTCDLCNLVDGGWSDWESWGACHLTCGDGIRLRQRNCSNPAPSTDPTGLDCPGNSTEEETCNDRACPVDGQWTTWSGWSACSVTCGTGLQRRDRNCSHPIPDADGEHCFGDSRDDRLCHRAACESAFLVTGVPNNDGHEALVLPNVITNIGGDYDNTTGKFNCSIAGIYEFHVMLEKERSHTEAHCSLLQNAVKTISLSAASSAGQPQVASNTAVLHLTPGDVVYLGDCSDAATLTGLTTFTGVLIQSD